MKKILSLSFFALTTIGCNNTPQQVRQSQPMANTNVSVQKQNDSATVSSHSFNAAEPKNTKPAQTNQPSSNESSPMAKAVDVEELTAEIERSEKAFKQNPKDEKVKEALARSYFERAFALTDAAQYRAALGDFRKGLKLNPNDQEAKNMHDEILRIFASINREPPKEGEEPKPMPFEKKET
jgi:tetratricopeptide (TPR) repeat protein